MDLASVVAALASVGVRVSGSAPNSSVQVNSSRACPRGLAGPGPSGTINDLGQHFHSAHGDEAETAEAKRIIEMERLMEEEGVKCFVVMAADAPLGTRMGREVRVLAPDGAESNKHLFPESCLQDDLTDDYAKSEAF